MEQQRLLEVSVGGVNELSGLGRIEMDGAGGGFTQVIVFFLFGEKTYLCIRDVCWQH